MEPEREEARAEKDGNGTGKVSKKDKRGRKGVKLFVGAHFANKPCSS